MSTASFRFRYLLGLLCHVALTLTGSSEPRARAMGAEILASCGSGASFATSTELKRWASFPVDVYLELDSLPPHARQSYQEGIARGLELWSHATAGRIGRFRLRLDRPDAPVRIRVSSAPLPENAVGSTELTFTETRIVSATVSLTRSRFEGTEHLARDVASTTAHEIGHVLGIIDHSPFPEDKMWASGNFRESSRARDPAALLTPRDVNTLEEAYCRPFEELSPTHERERRAQTRRERQ